MDTSLYLTLNHFARSTPWAHGFMASFALFGGVIILAVLLLAGWWRARSREQRIKKVSLSIWAGLGTVLAVGINQPISHLVGRVRPYYVLSHVEVLVPKANDFTFPSDHATTAGAAIVGLWLLRDKLIAILATIDGLFLAFARVYVGAHYPGDVLGGLVLGAVVVAVLRPIALRIIEPTVAAVASSPLKFLVESHGSATYPGDTREPTPRTD